MSSTRLPGNRRGGKPGRGRIYTRTRTRVGLGWIMGRGAKPGHGQIYPRNRARAGLGWIMGLWAGVGRVFYRVEFGRYPEGDWVGYGVALWGWVLSSHWMEPGVLVLDGTEDFATSWNGGTQLEIRDVHVNTHWIQKTNSDGVCFSKPHHLGEMEWKLGPGVLFQRQANATPRYPEYRVHLELNREASQPPLPVPFRSVSNVF